MKNNFGLKVHFESFLFVISVPFYYLFSIALFKFILNNIYIILVIIRVLYLVFNIFIFMLFIKKIWFILNIDIKNSFKVIIFELLINPRFILISFLCILFSFFSIDITYCSDDIPPNLSAIQKLARAFVCYCEIFPPNQSAHGGIFMVMGFVRDNNFNGLVNLSIEYIEPAIEVLREELPADKLSTFEEGLSRCDEDITAKLNFIVNMSRTDDSFRNILLNNLFDSDSDSDDVI